VQSWRVSGGGCSRFRLRAGKRGKREESRLPSQERQIWTRKTPLPGQIRDNRLDSTLATLGQNAETTIRPSTTISHRFRTLKASALQNLNALQQNQAEALIAVANALGSGFRSDSERFAFATAD